MMAHHLHQVNFAAASGGVRRAARFQTPLGPGPVFPHEEAVFILFPSSAYFYVPPPQNFWNMLNGWRPAYPVQDNYPYLRFLEPETYHYHAPASSATPSTSGNNGGQTSYRHHQTANHNTYDAEWMRNWIQEDETMIVDGTEHGMENSTMMPETDGGGLSEEVIGKWLKTRNPCREEEGVGEICAVCQDDLCQENDRRMIGVLDCRHEYHAACIKEWLRRKNFCPLCRAVALRIKKRS
ncbi:hypothetical protein Pfo_011267 [Paulownia fortunei]|nr:hypothetical protein Pfo_011267 [Paulownia fortunei]